MANFMVAFAGGHRIRVTPVPIPNTEVKPDTADGTARETVWESRSLPAVIVKPANVEFAGFFCWCRPLHGGTQFPVRCTGCISGRLAALDSVCGSRSPPAVRLEARLRKRPGLFVVVASMRRWSGSFAHV